MKIHVIINIVNPNYHGGCYGHMDHGVNIYLYKNGQSVQESFHESYYTNGQGGVVYDQGKYYSVISDNYYY